MASQIVMRISLAPCRSSAALGLSSCAARRCLSSIAARATRPQVLAPPAICTLPKYALQQSFRRGYAAPPPQPTVVPLAGGTAPGSKPPPMAPHKKGRFRRFLTWIWRITYLSVLAGIGYTAYLVWDLKNPTEQIEPDPSKKTLVILGTVDNLKL